MDVLVHQSFLHHSRLHPKYLFLWNCRLYCWAQCYNYPGSRTSSRTSSFFKETLLNGSYWLLLPLCLGQGLLVNLVTEILSCKSQSEGMAFLAQTTFSSFLCMRAGAANEVWVEAIGWDLRKWLWILSYCFQLAARLVVNSPRNSLEPWSDLQDGNHEIKMLEKENKKIVDPWQWRNYCTIFGLLSSPFRWTSQTLIL